MCAYSLYKKLMCAYSLYKKFYSLMFHLNEVVHSAVYIGVGKKKPIPCNKCE